ncbi:hypothetical protein [Halegenticoccus tardaugens]|uniref:hypothetical protein n=1 Tax=Halegenticoccus tardaugens TaxID=2071624 RepID=UPI00100A6B10|nr:hypothetical protein [Halegenticoccus tardaugens]
MTDDLLRALHAELEATEELPIRREANLWIGEAQAVAADLVDSAATAETIRERVDHVEELLERVDETDSAEADERVERALSITAAIRRRFDPPR